MISIALKTILAPAANVRAVRNCLAGLWRHRALCQEMVKHDLGGPFTGQVLGRFWIIGHPLILYAVYVFIFGIVLKTRIAQNVEMPRDYITYVLAGLAPWMSTQQALARAPTTLLAHSNLVKQVVFPIEVLPLSAIIASGIPLLIGVAIVLLRSLLFDADLPLTVILLPLAIALHAAFLLGIAYVLAAVTPFFRDLKDVISALLVVGVFLVPAFYLPQWVPPLLKPWLYLNPFSYIVWIYQDILYFGDIRHPFAWLISFILAIGGLALGVRSFQKLKPLVANVL